MPKLVAAYDPLSDRTKLPNEITGTHNCGQSKTGARLAGPVGILSIVCTPSIVAYLVDSQGSVVAGGIDSASADPEGTWKISINASVPNDTYSIVVVITCTCKDTVTGNVYSQSSAVVTITGLAKP
jgi:hypothetical protein